MKKLIVGSVIALSLTACAAQAPPSPTVTVTAPPPTTQAPVPVVPEPDPVPGGEELFIAVLEEEYGPLPAKTERQAVDIAKQACSMFEQYGVDETLNIIVDIVKSEGLDGEVTGFIIGAGTATFCPEYEQKLYNATQTSI